MSDQYKLKITGDATEVDVVLPFNPASIKSIIVPVNDRHARVTLRDVEYDMRDDTFYVYVRGFMYVV